MCFYSSSGIMWGMKRFSLNVLAFTRPAAWLLLGVMLVCSLGLNAAEAFDFATPEETAASQPGVLDQITADAETAYEGSLLQDGVNGVGTFLSDGNKALGALAGGIQSGLGSINSFLGIGGLGGGGGGNRAPNVPNGGLLPGPGNSSLGVAYVRDVFLPGITNWIVAVVLAGSVIVIMGAGLMYIVGGGDQEMQNKAREAMVWGVIGTVVTILAYALVRIVIGINFLG